MSVDTSLEPRPAKDFGYREAQHLLQRAGFDANPQAVAQLAERGRDDAIKRLVAYQRIKAPELEEFEVSRDLVPYLTEREQALYEKAKQREKAMKQMGQMNMEQMAPDVAEKLRKRKEKAKREDRQAFDRLQRWWFKRMVNTPRPLEERLTLLWHDHFATSYDKVDDTYLMYRQNRVLRRLAGDNFGKLVHAVIRDPAMIQYLDNHKNRKRHPNENLARELLELFTLGEGQYSEYDIKQAARALTGLTYEDNEPAFRKQWHDDGQKVIFGQRGKFGPNELVNLILRRRGCSEYVAFKLYQHFVADVPEDTAQMPPWAIRVMRQLAAELRAHEYDLRPVLEKLFRSRHFYDPAVVGKKVKSPIQLTVGTIRSMNTPTRDLGQVRRAMRRMGQELFKPPNVAGWPSGRAWINSSTLFVRQNLCAYLITGKYQGQSSRPNDQTPFDPNALLSQLNAQKPKMATNELIDRFVGPHAPEARREPIVRFAKDHAGNRLGGDTLKSLLVLITAMPEYQLH